MDETYGRRVVQENHQGKTATTAPVEKTARQESRSPVSRHAVTVVMETKGSGFPL